MSKMILKSTLILSLFVFNVHAQSSLDKDFLANQCYDLAHAVTDLVLSQQNTTCVDKLYMASTQMNAAGLLISTNVSDAAKQIIDNAVSALQFAELSGCNRFIQISHSKLEANKLKHLL